MLSIVYYIKPKFTTSVYIVKLKQKWRREGGGISMRPLEAGGAISNKQ